MGLDVILTSSSSLLWFISIVIMQSGETLRVSAVDTKRFNGCNSSEAFSTFDRLSLHSTINLPSDPCNCFFKLPQLFVNFSQLLAVGRYPDASEVDGFNFMISGLVMTLALSDMFDDDSSEIES